ncbi:unnamed protein product [Linum trigynum]|uniref:AP2/ERF domain-containing protein n=1 Tax=Linum trigynum TaxID=586398 RepID=A0AAV2DKK2_9ROSI
MASTKMKKRQRLSPSSSTSSLSSISSTSSSSTVTAAAAAASSSPCSPSSSTSTSCSSSSPCCSCNAAINNHTPPPVAESHELEVEVEALPKSKRRKRTRSTKSNAAAADRRVKKESKNNGEEEEEEEKSIGTGGGSSLPLPPHPPGRRSSAFRGVTRHRWTGRFEAHLWDKSSWNNMHNKKGRQVYLGAYDDEEAAARTYDLAALKYWGPGTTLNFPVEGYEKEMEEMGKVTKEEYLASLRRRSSGFSRGVSKYRGVARHHHNGRWEARIGRVLGNKYLYLGTFNTQEEAAEAYDLAALEYRGANAVTNFDVANYVDRLKAKGLNVDQFIHPSPPPPAPELEVDAVDAVRPPPASPSPPPPLPSLDEEETEAGAEVAAMMMMMPPPPPRGGDSDSMIAIEELLDFEHDDGMSGGWSMCLDYPENAAVATAGCAGLPELFGDAGGFQLDDIDYLVFDAEFLDGDGGGRDVNDKKPLSDDDGSTTTSVSCN